MNGRHDRLRRVLDSPQQHVHACGTRERELARAQRCEDVDVGASDERVPGPDQDNRVDGPVGGPSRDGLTELVPDLGAESIDRRVVDGEDGDAVPDSRNERA